MNLSHNAPKKADSVNYSDAIAVNYSELHMHKPRRHTPAPGGFRIGFIIVGNVTSMLKVK